MIEPVVGVDGCRAGWLACFWQNEDMQIRLFATIEDLAQSLPGYTAYIDMPIGLPEAEARQVEKEARSFLGKRACCVFSVPSRSAVYASSYAASCAINFSLRGVKLSRQTWNLCAKIKQLDQFIRHGGSAMEFLEAHPELVFCLLKGSPMLFSKHTQEGRKQRIELLDSAGLPITALLDQQAGRYRRSQVAVDDILDAAVLFALSLFEPTPLLAHTVFDEFGISSNMMIPAGRL